MENWRGPTTWKPIYEAMKPTAPNPDACTVKSGSSPTRNTGARTFRGLIWSNLERILILYPAVYPAVKMMYPAVKMMYPAVKMMYPAVYPAVKRNLSSTHLQIIRASSSKERRRGRRRRRTRHLPWWGGHRSRRTPQKLNRKTRIESFYLEGDLDF